jgi:hypothetical protein
MAAKKTRLKSHTSPANTPPARMGGFVNPRKNDGSETDGRGLQAIPDNLVKYILAMLIKPPLSGEREQRFYARRNFHHRGRGPSGARDLKKMILSSEIFIIL